jgi:hypothetical protein
MNHNPLLLTGRLTHLERSGMLSLFRHAVGKELYCLPHLLYYQYVRQFQFSIWIFIQNFNQIIQLIFRICSQRTGVGFILDKTQLDDIDILGYRPNVCIHSTGSFQCAFHGRIQVIVMSFDFSIQQFSFIRIAFLSTDVGEVIGLLLG